MVRRYDSTRRKKAAGQTRNEILQAAMKLHWEGITEFGPLAREAGCSLPTLRKHFPTKEALFRDCTRTFTETLTMPDLEALGGIADPPRRLEESVSELCRIHEAMFGYAWHSAHRGTGAPRFPHLPGTTTPGRASTREGPGGTDCDPSPARSWGRVASPVHSTVRRPGL
jgi:AcrR family transcriptional regulator